MKKELVSFEGLYCANCSAPMQGEFCHECGQSIHSVLRPMHHMVEDTLDMVLHIDGRVVHTVPPLFYKPGFLTMEYFAGRRQRYVAPFRLMFVLCLLAFFVTRIAIDNVGFTDTNLEASAGTGDFAKDNAADAVRARFETMRKDIDKAADNAEHGKKTIRKLISVERDHANHRLEQLGAAPLAAQTEDGWDFHQNKIESSWLPDSMVRSLNRSLEHMGTNLRGAMVGGEEGAAAQERILAGVFGVLPQTMFVVMPLFALLLKLMYLFKRRLYMEHLIVALHSHAFMFLVLFLGVLVGGLRSWLVPHAAWASTPLLLVIWALGIWVPVYLLIMQKRVYRQGWFLTTVKYLFIGWCYSWLIGFALGFAALLGLAH
ncbi:DUF3667 domain-containing protein [Dyella jiangningensis]|uniref:DUF3667 domain-containing protein n=1 Tax=Dyella jiangningensis TaxID=1379159 RepID=A0A328P0V2_9GAMM|nr:DUF3667 domain-containing protein [Dyella jiangningensis]RAO75847.1 hypothetical protein CA260_17610 [Dyella jiangningensis]